MRLERQQDTSRHPGLFQAARTVLGVAATRTTAAISSLALKPPSQAGAPDPGLLEAFARPRDPAISRQEGASQAALDAELLWAAQGATFQQSLPALQMRAEAHAQKASVLLDAESRRVEQAFAEGYVGRVAELEKDQFLLRGHQRIPHPSLCDKRGLGLYEGLWVMGEPRAVLNKVRSLHLDGWSNWIQGGKEGTHIAMSYLFRPMPARQKIA